MLHVSYVENFNSFLKVYSLIALQNIRIECIADQLKLDLVCVYLQYNIKIKVLSKFSC